MCGNELSDRKKQILKAIIEAHIAGGEPVGSKYLTEALNFSCSSATIRNEMAELEAMGYLEQPHTSSGRIPSDLGYRFYVDSLANDYAMTTGEVEKINELLKVKMNEVDKILESASKVASALTNYTGIAIKPRPTSAHISRFEAMPLDERHMILVMLTSLGNIKSKKIRSEMSLSTEDIERIVDSLNACFAGIPADRVTLPIVMKFEGMLGDFSLLASSIVKSIYEVMNEMGGGELRYSGIDHLLQYPEFSDITQFKQLLGVLENKEDILNIVSDSTKDDISVYIGSESPVKLMNNSSLVFKTIRKDGKAIGAIGVIGPTRMDYAKVLATISSLSGNIASMLEIDRIDAAGSGGEKLLGEGRNDHGDGKREEK